MSENRDGKDEYLENPRKFSLSKILLRVFKILSRAFIVLLILMILISLAIQTPQVQNWVTSKASDYLSEELGSEVSIGSFRLSFFDKLQLEEVVVKDYNQDTLLRAGEVTADFRAPIFTVINKRLELRNIILRNTSLNMTRKADDELYNINYLMEHLQGKRDPDKNTDSKQGFDMEVNLDNIFLQNIRFTQRDSLYGSTLKIALERGRVQADKIDLTNEEFHLKRLRLIEPSVSIDKFEPAIESTEMDTAGSIPLLFRVESFQLDRGQFSLSNHMEEELYFPYYFMDYEHMNIHDINIEAQDVQFHDWETLVRKINRISVKTDKGFVITNLQSDSVKVSPEITQVNNARLHTPDSRINADIEFTYNSFHDWINFVDDVHMHVQSRNSVVLLNDVMNFAPGLYETDFFLNNKDKTLSLDGLVVGSVNNLRATGIKAGFDKSYIQGDIRIRDATTPEKLFLNIALTDSRIKATDAEELVQGLEIDESFHRLGTTRITGDYTGTLKDFNLNTKMQSGLGEGEFNVNLSLKDSIENAEYDGHIVLNQFDLGNFLDADSLGEISLDILVEEGKGLSPESVDAVVTGYVHELEFKRYPYKHIRIDGRASNNSFIGAMGIKDENINIGFIGTAFFQNLKKPTFDMDLVVNKLDLHELNITKEPLELSFLFSGTVDSFDLYELNANSTIDNIKVLYRDSIDLSLDYLNVTASSSEGKENKLHIESDIVDAAVTGDYSWIKSLASLQNYFIYSFPQLSEKWDLELDSVAYDSDLDFKVNVKNTQGFLVLIDEKLDTIKDLSLAGIINTEERYSDIQLHVPEITYDGNVFMNGYLTLYTGNGFGNVVFGVDSTVLKNKINLSPVSVAGDLTYDTLTFNLNIADYQKDKDNFNIDGKVYPTLERYALEFKDDFLHVFNRDWNVNSKNYIEFGKKFLNVDSLYFQQGDKLISVNSTKPNQLTFNMENIALETFNKNIANDSLEIFGNVFLELDLNDIYDLNQIEGKIRVEDFKVNDDPYGLLTINVIDDGTGNRSKVNVSAIREGQELYADGFIRPKDLENFYDLDIHGKEVPFTILEYLLYESISRTEGKIDADLKITGALDRPKINGEGRLYDAQTQFDLLGVTYFVKDADFSITPSLIDLSGGEIYDKYDNVAKIEGGLIHDHFQDFGADINISSDKFLLMNSTKEINAFYYGHCLGSANVDINGPFTQPNINIEAENAEDTQFYMSIFESEEVREAGFVRFVSQTDTIQEKAVREESNVPTGLNLHLNLTANEKGKVKIFMDKDQDNYIESTGKGNIILDLKRSGEISMFGNYNISTGTYRYSFNLIKRSFDVREGGYIQWTGDPLDANMNIVAAYNTYASPYPLLVNYQISRQEAPPTPVNVLIYLNGPILHPDIEFDLELPELQGNLRAYMENSLASLRSDQSKLDFQALSLITVGDFWPDEGAGSGVVYSGTAKTLTGFLSSQVSGFLSYMVNQAIRDVGFIDYIDVDVNLNYMANNIGDISGEDLQNLNQFGANEVGVNMRYFLFDERAIVELGGDYVEGNSISAAGAYVKGNVSIQYVLTDDRRLRVNLYSNTDHIIEGYQVKSGVGLRYQREFDSFEGFYNSIKSSLRHLNPEKKVR